MFVTGVVCINNKNVGISVDDGVATAKVVNFFNDLFDSVNGSERMRNGENELQRPIMKESVHHAFWVSAKRMLKKMYYVEKVSREIVKSVPTLKNWLHTVEAFQNIWKIVNVEYDFNKLNTRFCNQDPLENFFGQIRSHAVRYTNPTPRHFEESFITLLVSNMKSFSIIGGNCETTNDDFMLYSLEECLKDDASMQVQDVVRNDDCNKEASKLFTDNIVTEESIVTLLFENSEVIIIPILKKFNYCSECDNSLRSAEFSICARLIVCIVNKLLKTRSHRQNIVKIMSEYIENCNLNMNWHECTEHHIDLYKTMIRVIVTKTVEWWCVKKNKLIYSENNDELYNNIVEDIVQMKQMRNYYKINKSKRRQMLIEYRNHIRETINK